MNTGFHVDKDLPSPAWIEDLRQRFPVEAEIDRILQRKLRHRAGPGYVPQTLETLCDGTIALLRTVIDEPFEILEPRWLSGGASKLQMAFTLNWYEPGIGSTKTPLVLRMEPAAANVETSRAREYQLISAMHDVVPVPPAFSLDKDGTFLPYPAIIYGFAPGVTKPSSATAGVSGLGTRFHPEVRPILGQQFVNHLAAIHTHDWRASDLSAFDIPEPGLQAVEWQINWWERVWEEDAEEDVPLMRLAATWLRRNMPAVDRLSIVHGDYRTGNFLYTENNNRISAILDWELGHLGDRHEDLAWVMNPTYGHIAEDGSTFLTCGFMPQSQLLDLYQEASRLDVDPKRIEYYRILNTYKVTVIVLATGYRVARAGKTHQDILLAWLINISYTMLEDLRARLEEAF